MNPVKVFLIDDSEIHLAGLKWLLSGNEDMVVVGSARNAADVIASRELPCADVVLLDLSLVSEYDGIELIDPIFTIQPAIKIIILSHHKDIKPIVKSIQKGVSAYIAKDTDIEELIALIHLVIKGNGFFLGETIPKSTLLECFSETHKSNHVKPWNLSEREIEIINLLSKGYISKEIAEVLNITIPTVESHKENIKQKLHCKTIIDVVVFALKNGLIS